MSKKLQVFISSTYSDLKKERQEVIEAILDADHIPTGMELFKPIDKPQKSVIEKNLKNSDVYMLVLGGRYGTIDPETGISYTEWEYDLAKTLEIPGFSLVLTEDYIDKSAKKGCVKPSELEMGSEKYKEFKEKVMDNLISQIDSFSSIKGSVYRSLGEIQNEHTELIGWVRGNTVENKKDTIHPKTDNLHIPSEASDNIIRNRINLNPLNSEKIKIGFYRKPYIESSGDDRTVRISIPSTQTINTSKFDGILNMLSAKFKIQFKVLKTGRVQIKTDNNETTALCLKDRADSFFGFYNKMQLSSLSLIHHNPSDCDILTTKDLLVLENSDGNKAVLKILEIKSKRNANESDQLKIQWNMFY